MIIHSNPRRTRLLLRIRRILTARQRNARPDWPDEAITKATNEDMQVIAKLPMRKVRLALVYLQ